MNASPTLPFRRSVSLVGHEYVPRIDVAMNQCKSRAALRTVNHRPWMSLEEVNHRSRPVRF